MREWELVEAPRMRALPEGSYDYKNLIEFLRLYPDAVRLVVNKPYHTRTKRLG